jgi:hypothetical protein
MRTTLRDNSFKSRLRQMFRRRRRRHDPLLVLNLSTFNFTDGWSRTFSQQTYGRFSA